MLKFQLKSIMKLNYFFYDVRLLLFKTHSYVTHQSETKDDQQWRDVALQDGELDTNKMKS